MVDGVVERDPAHGVSGSEAIEVDGKPLAGPEQFVTYALNKPAGVVSTAKDTHGRPTVVSLLADLQGVRLYPVGRLDVDTTGLILLTNDGELANLLTHPRHEVAKTYRVTVRSGPVSAKAVRALAHGVKLEDGRTAPTRARLLAPDVIELELKEGRNRQVRRMCEAVGHRVQSLRRTRIGTLELGRLAIGSYRKLSQREVDALRAAARR